MIPQLAGVVHDNDDDDIGTDDDNIVTDPSDPTPIEREDEKEYSRELKDKKPLATNNEPTDEQTTIKQSDTTSEITVDNTSDRSV